MGKTSLNVVEKYTIGQRIFYGCLWILFYPVRYLTLIPFFIMNMSFTRSPNPKISSKCVRKSEDEVVYRDVSSVGELKGPFCDYRSITDILKNLVVKDPEKMLIGSRPILEREDYQDPISGKTLKRLHLGDYEWKSRQQILNTIHQYSCGLISLDLHQNEHNKVAIFADNCEEWFLSSQAILLTGRPLVTVYTTLPDESIMHALNLTSISHIIVDEKSFDRFLNIYTQCETIKHVIMLSSCDKSKYENHAVAERVQLHTFKELCSVGEHLTLSTTFTPTQDDETALIMFTSGSTGLPKGVKISHKNILTQIGSEIENRHQWANKLFAAFLPSSHILEFVVELSIMAYGGAIGFCTPLTLTDKSPMIIPGTKGDLPMLRPQLTLFVPLLLDRLSKAVLLHFKAQPPIKQALIQFLIDYKKHFLIKGHNTSIVDKVVFSKVAEIVGGRSDITLSAGAPLCPELALFSSAIFCLNLKQGYGTTETMCGGSLGKSSDPYSNDTGHITPANEIKLVPWVEGGYYPTDTPYPRGEVYIGGNNVAHGYYGNDAQTEESFFVDDKGLRWFRTGDVGQITANGNLKIIDRKKDIIKLKHGEYVSVTRIESILIKSKYVDMICVAPNSDSSYLVAIVVPNRQQIVNFVKSMGMELVEDITSYFVDAKVCDAMVEDIKKMSMSLHKFDRPEKYFFVKEIWAPENNLTTPSMKLKRPEIHRFYREILD